jgi:hypothetical protein
MGGPRYSFMCLASFVAWSFLVRIRERMAPTRIIAPIRPPPGPAASDRLRWN